MITGDEGYSIPNQYLLTKSQKESFQTILSTFNLTLPEDMYKVRENILYYPKYAKAAEYFVVLIVTGPILSLIGAHSDLVELFNILYDIVSVVVSRIIDGEDVNSACKKCDEHFDLFLKMYGSQNISINNHTIFHIADMLRKWGPLYNFHLFPFERGNFDLKQTNVSNRDTSEMEMLKANTQKSFMILDHSIALYDDKGLLRGKTLANLNVLPTLPSKENVDQIFVNSYQSIGNERLPEGSRFIGKSENYELNEVEIYCITKVLQVDRTVSMELPKSCKAYGQFKFGDITYKSDPSSSAIEATPGSLVGVLFNDGGITEFLTQISAFLEYEWNGSIYYLMRVRYWRRRPRTGRLASQNRVYFFDKGNTFADGGDIIIPINRIYSRFALLREDIAVEIPTKLRF